MSSLVEQAKSIHERAERMRFYEVGITPEQILSFVEELASLAANVARQVELLEQQVIELQRQTPSAS